MSSTDTSNNISSSIEQPATEGSSIVIRRLVWIAVLTIALWAPVLAYILWGPHDPVDINGKPIEAAASFGLKISGALLSANILTSIIIQAFAPPTVLRRRLISNSVFSMLIFTICSALAMVAHIIPEPNLSILKGSATVVFQPPFLIANLIVTGLSGLIIYRLRKEELFDVAELYWTLGLLFLLLLAVALVVFVSG